MTRAHRFSPFQPLAVGLSLALGVLVALPLPVRAGNDGVVPDHTPKNPSLSTAKIEEKIGTQVPMDLTFRDEDEQPIKFGDAMAGKPTILVPVYYRCPMLCTKILNGLLEALRAMPSDFSAGNQFTVVTVSMDPMEHSDLAKRKKDAYLNGDPNSGQPGYGRPGAENGWRFLTGDKENIAGLLDAVGYRFEFDKMLKEYNHPSALIILSPQGKVTRYFYGLGYDGEFEVAEESGAWAGKQKPQLTESELRERKSGERKFTHPTTTLRLSLIEAADGKGGSLLDKLTLLCYRYDHLNQGYALDILWAVRIGGIITLLLVCAGVLFAVRREGLVGSVLLRASLFGLIVGWLGGVVVVSALSLGTERSILAVAILTLGFLVGLVALRTAFRRQHERRTGPPGPPDGPTHALPSGGTA